MFAAVVLLACVYADLNRPVSDVEAEASAAKDFATHLRNYARGRVLAERVRRGIEGERRFRVTDAKRILGVSSSACEIESVVDRAWRVNYFAFYPSLGIELEADGLTGKVRRVEVKWPGPSLFPPRK